MEELKYFSDILVFIALFGRGKVVNDVMSDPLGEANLGRVISSMKKWMLPEDMSVLLC